jgi:hypothetical protein
MREMGTTTLEPERMLCAAILRQAVVDLRSNDPWVAKDALRFCTDEPCVRTWASLMNVDEDALWARVATAVRVARARRHQRR